MTDYARLWARLEDECKEAKDLARLGTPWSPHTAQRIANTMHEAGEAIARIVLYEQRIAALERELGEAREALRPFAERGKAEFTTGDFRNPEPAPESQIFGSELFLTVGDLRRATLVHARLSPSPSELAGETGEG